MKLEFFADIQILITLTWEEFDYIFQSAKNHYSFDCTSMTQQGGNLYGWKGRWDFAIKKGAPIEEWVQQYDFSNREFQLLIKAIEFDANPMANELKNKLWKALHAWQSMRELTAEFLKNNQPKCFLPINEE